MLTVTRELGLPVHSPAEIFLSQEFLSVSDNLGILRLSRKSEILSLLFDVLLMLSYNSW